MASVGRAHLMNNPVLLVNRRCFCNDPYPPAKYVTFWMFFICCSVNVYMSDPKNVFVIKLHLL